LSSDRGGVCTDRQYKRELLRYIAKPEISLENETKFALLFAPYFVEVFEKKSEMAQSTELSHFIYTISNASSIKATR
jgi:hypothetical protein